jgi:hypothetical protein
MRKQKRAQTEENEKRTDCFYAIHVAQQSFTALVGTARADTAVAVLLFCIAF